MKKMLKIAVSMALALMMLITPSLAIIAPEDAAPNFSTALDEYFAVRAETLVSPQNRTRSLSNQFSSLETTRAQNFATVDENIEIVDALAEYAIVSSEINGNVAVLDVYEWSWLEYYADDTVTTTNNMGFGTEHRMTLNKINGEWVIVNDKYDESDVTGVSTLAANETLVLNYDRSLLNEVYAKTVGVEKLEQQETEIAQAEESGVMIASTNANQRSTSDTTSIAANYNPYKAIEYADMWVYQGYATGGDDSELPGDTEGMMRPYWYNPDYPYYHADCVNYVSQCLHEGGIPMVPPPDMTNLDQRWNENYWATTKADRETAIKDSSEIMSTTSWRYTPRFKAFWEAQRFDSIPVSQSDQTSVYPGNPVYYTYNNNSSGHAAICVGYNAAGNPIYNSHNRDMYHALYNLAFSSAISNNYSVYTFQITAASYEIYGPEIAHDFGTLSQGMSASQGEYFPEGTHHYFKFTVPSQGNYSIYSENYLHHESADPYVYLYKESEVKDGKTLYMLTIAEDDDSSVDGNFYINTTLAAGTYYIKVRLYNMNYSGYTKVVVEAN